MPELKTDDYDYESATKYGARPSPYGRDIDPETGKPRMHWPSTFKKDTHPNRFIMSEIGIFDTKYSELVPLDVFGKIATPAQRDAILKGREVIPKGEVQGYLDEAKQFPDDMPVRGTQMPRYAVPKGMINRGR